MQMTFQGEAITFREGQSSDIDDLLAVEEACFKTDRLTRRSFRHWLKAPHGCLLVVDVAGEVLGYGLLWCHKGTRLARLYSLAVSPQLRGLGVARQLMQALEQAAIERDRLYMRLEVAENNHAAIALYQQCGYRVFGEYDDYYEDHSDALRMQKTIQHVRMETLQRRTPWYQQSTQFTCGPAALMMAIGSFDETFELDQQTELAIWRQATTIYMTSGHGGCHPLGLALAARDRGFSVEVLVNTQSVLFVDGVRSAHKKNVLEVVQQQFLEQIAQCSAISVDYREFTLKDLKQWLDDGYAVMILISTYRLDGKKAPHWVTLTGIDNRCFYVHDPDIDQHDANQLAIDCQYLPISLQDFEKISAFGSGRLRTALALKPLAKSSTN